MTHHVLQIGGITDVMKARIEERFTIHQLEDVDSVGSKITHVATNGHDGVPPHVLAACPNLQMVACYGVGYDGIDTDVCVARGVPVSHTPNVLNQEVATTAVMLMLALFRNLLADDSYVRAGRWAKEGSAPLSRTADGRTVGIIGLGRIGQAIADKLAAFDATVIYHSRNKKDVALEYYADLTAMARNADVLICITPGGPETHHLVNREVMDALGPDGTLINVSRGSVVDEKAMVSALKDGRLGWAGLDVFEAEPQVPDALKAMPNVVLLPHVGSGTHETRAAMGGLVVDNLIAHIDTGWILTSVPETAHLKP